MTAPPTLREWVLHELDRVLHEPSPAIRLSIISALRAVVNDWPNVTYMGQTMENLPCVCGHLHTDHGDGVVHSACCARDCECRAFNPQPGAAPTHLSGGTCTRTHQDPYTDTRHTCMFGATGVNSHGHRQIHECQCGTTWP